MNGLGIDVRPPRHVDLRCRDLSNESTIQALKRGLEVLRAFGSENDRMTIAQAARVTGLTRAGARRILLTLEHLGYVRSHERHYYLTARVLEIARGFLSQAIWRSAQDALLRVAETLNETASAGVLDGTDVVYTVRVRSSRVLQLEMRAGARLPAFVSSMGRVLLAALPAAALSRYFASAKLTRFTTQTLVNPEILRRELQIVRTQGWCHTRGEIETGICCVAVPVVDSQGRTIAALNVSTRTDRTTPQTARNAIVPLLCAAAASIRGDLEK